MRGARLIDDLRVRYPLRRAAPSTSAGLHYCGGAHARDRARSQRRGLCRRRRHALPALPSSNPNRLFLLLAPRPSGGGAPWVPGAAVLAVGRSRTMASVAGVTETGTLEPLNPDEAIWQRQEVTEDTFAVLRVTPVLGRSFVPGDGTRRPVRVGLLSYGAWQRRFGGDAHVPGRIIEFRDGPVEIAGVLPDRFIAPIATWIQASRFTSPTSRSRCTRSRASPICLRSFACATARRRNRRRPSWTLPSTPLAHRASGGASTRARHGVARRRLRVVAADGRRAAVGGFTCVRAHHGQPHQPAACAGAGTAARGRRAGDARRLRLAREPSTGGGVSHAGGSGCRHGGAAL